MHDCVKVINFKLFMAHDLKKMQFLVLDKLQ